MSPSTKWVTFSFTSTASVSDLSMPKEKQRAQASRDLLWRVLPELRLQGCFSVSSISALGGYTFAAIPLERTLGVSLCPPALKAEIPLCCGVTPSRLPVPRPPGKQKPSRKMGKCHGSPLRLPCNGPPFLTGNWFKVIKQKLNHKQASELMLQ